jgi:hypothetical protein
MKKSIKKYSVLSMVLFMFFLSINAQETNEEQPTSIINMVARYLPEANSVEIRFFPDKKSILYSGIKNGFVVERAEISAEIKLEEDIKYVRIAEVFSFDEVQWKDAFSGVNEETKHNLNLAKDFFDNIDKQIGGIFNFDDGIKEMKEQKSKEDFEYLIFVMNAIKDKYVAEAIGLSYTDKSVQKNKNYLYRIKLSKEPKSTYKVVGLPFNIETDVNKKQGERKIYTVVGDKELSFLWEENDMVSGALVERKNIKSGEYELLNKSPGYTLGETSNRNGFKDVNLTNYQEYDYRFYGYNPFGEKILFGSAKAMPKDLTPPKKPLLIKAKHEKFDEVSVEWNARYSEYFGALRGGAQPVRVGDKFFNVVHSSFNMLDGREYVGAVYEYSAKFPFEPIRELPVPLNLGTPKAEQNGGAAENTLNSTTSHVVYPTGLVINDRKVFISAGINDSDLALISGTLEDLTTGMLAARVAHVMHIDRSAKSLVLPRKVPVITTKIPVFWWYAKGNVINSNISNAVFQYGNFGDDASPLLVTKLSGIESRRVVPGEKKLLAIGSILHRAKDGDIVWGSGLKSDEALDSHPGGDILVTAVRGPKTLKVLERAGWDTSNIKAMFDPGVLLRHIYADRLAQYDMNQNKRFGKIRIVPHFKDDLVFKRQRPDLIKHFISADGDPLRILESMLGADLVISSSLHGIIFAESLGIPAIWLDSPGGEGHFKYLDYYEGTGRVGVQVVPTLSEALSAQPPELPEFDFEKLLATFPAKEIAELASKRMPMATGEIIGGKARSSYREDFEHSTSKSLVLRNGALWMLGIRGTILLAPLEIDGDFSAVKITMVPAVLAKTRAGFKVKVSLEGGASATVQWENGSRVPKEIQLPVSKEIWNQGVRISLKANAVGMGGGRISLKNVGMSLGIISVGIGIPG